MELTILVVFGIGLGLGYWAYKCSQKEECKFTGECNTVFKHLKKASLTAEQAKKLYGIKHLRSVISRLRNVYDQDIVTVVKDKKAVYKKK